MSTIQWVFFFLIILHFSIKWLLEHLNIRYSFKSAGDYIDTFGEETVEKTKGYSLDKYRLELGEMLISTFLLIIILIFPILPFFYDLTSNWVEKKLWGETFFVLFVFITLAVPNLPFEIWKTFKIEGKYGFNKMNFKLWVSDKIKGLLIAIVFFLPLLFLLLYLVEKMGSYWWVAGAGIVVLFQLLLLLFYPMLILPLFNKFSPLPDGDLKKRLFDLAQKTSFSTGDIQVMDGSKRSGHSNAFFTGFGKFRKIVLFDTLVEQLNEEEVESVLAHEIGHYKKGHVPKRLIFSFFMVFVSFAIINWAMNQTWLYETFGLSTPSFASTIILLSLYGGLISFVFSPIMNWRSRKDEYEADNYAKKIVGTKDFLINALKKLTKKNLSNFEPHPLYSFIYYSHPTLKEREKVLSQTAN